MSLNEKEKVAQTELVEESTRGFGGDSKEDDDGAEGDQEDFTLVQETENSNSSTLSASGNSDSLIGKTIGGHYLIVDRIGTGGMSAVYEAKHLLLNKTVALKMIFSERVNDGKTLMRFQQEAKAATSLNHPNIAVVSEFGLDEEKSPFLVMEYVKGMPLSQVLEKERTLSRERSLAIMSQLCSALQYAHESGVVHRDIKPSNIILQKDANGNEVVKIIDFGIAKLLTDETANLTQTGDVFGTPNYMSPEQCLGKLSDRRSDVYALGCVFEEMLAGAPPFRAESALETLMMHVNATPQSKVKTAEKTVILRALEKSKDDRFQTVKEMQDAILALEDHKSGSLQLDIPSRRRNMTGILVGAVFSIFAIGLALYGYMNIEDETKKLAIAVALLFYVGGMVNIAVSHLQKKK